MKKKKKVLTEVTDKDLMLLKNNPEKFWKGVKNVGYDAFRNCKTPFDIVIPKGVGLYSTAFKGSSVRKVEIADKEFSNLSAETFILCKNLEEVVLPDSIKRIGFRCFEGCSNLKNINLPNTLTEIESGTFRGCGFTEVTLPKLLTKIGESAFEQCENLKKVNFCSRKEKNEYALNQGIKLEPTSFELGRFSFAGCVNLEDINLNEIDSVNVGAFKDCESLKSVDISRLWFIPKEMFANCKNLTDVNLSMHLTRIGEYAFRNTNIESFIPQHGSPEIQKGAFNGCLNLKEVVLKSRYDELILAEGAFENCENLEKVFISKDLQYLCSSTFKNCKSLKEVEFEEGSKLKFIGHSCFQGCVELEEIKNFSATDKDIGFSAFRNCDKLKAFEISKDCELENGTLLKYICKVGDKFYTSNEILSDDYVKINGEASYLGMVFDNWSDVTLFRRNFNSLSEKDLEAINSAYIYMINLLHARYPKEEYIRSWSIPTVKNFIKNIENFSPQVIRNIIPTADSSISTLLNYVEELNADRYIKFLNNLQKKGYDISDGMVGKKLNKLYYNLGGLQNLSYETKLGNGKTVNISYDQKIAEFLTGVLADGKATLTELGNISDYMNIEGFKKDFTEFFIGKKDKHTYNFDEMMQAEREFNGFITNCYNNYEEIQKSNTSDKASQRQLKPTFEHFYSSYINAIDGINKYNEDIAKTVIKYFAPSKVQDAFDTARIVNANRLGYDLNFKFSKLDNATKNEVLEAIESNNKSKINKYKNLFTCKEQVQDNILADNLSEEIIKDKLNKLDKLLENCAETSTNTLNTGIEIANNFSFEWLKKSDPLNFVLGKLCNCCAHLDGAGIGIMNASIIHPNIQNLVIKDKRGEIVAKSTLYINKEQGYAVFNNVEVAEGRFNEEEYKEIYDKFMLGATSFMQQYNAESKKELRIITVGCSNNDLIRQLRSNNTISNKIYKPINYRDYGLGRGAYNGDSLNEQYIVLENKELER